jgi:hypothetical protein
MEFEIIEGVRKKPFTCFLYGPPKVGKTTLASKADRPLVLDLEGGADEVGVRRIATHGADMMFTAAKWAGGREDVGTIIIDSATEVEKSLADNICKLSNKGNLAAFDYGKGYAELKAQWARVLRMTKLLQDHYKKNVIIIGHTRVKTFADPMSESYDRYEPELHKDVIPMICASVDAILFMRPRTIVRENESDKRKVAVGTGRELHTRDSPAFIAGNRFDLKPVYLDPDASLWDAMKGNANV